MDGIQVAWQASAKRSSRSLEKRREQHRHEGLGEPLDRHVKLRRGRERNNIVIERTEEVRKGIKYELWHEWWCGREEEKKRQWKVDVRFWNWNFLGGRIGEKGWIGEVRYT